MKYKLLTLFGCKKLLKENGLQIEVVATDTGYEVTVKRLDLSEYLFFDYAYGNPMFKAVRMSRFYPDNKQQLETARVVRHVVRYLYQNNYLKNPSA